MSESSISYTELLRECYGRLVNSRLAHHRESEQDAREHFQKILNDSLPRNKYEEESKKIVRNIYYSNKTEFLNNHVRKLPELILLTEARAIVNTFGIQDIVYVSWHNDESRYEVHENTTKNTYS